MTASARSAERRSPRSDSAPFPPRPRAWRVRRGSSAALTEAPARLFPLSTSPAAAALVTSTSVGAQARSPAMMPVRNTPSNVPAPPIETTGAPSSPILGRFNRSAPIRAPMEPETYATGDAEEHAPTYARAEKEVERQHHWHEGAAHVDRDDRHPFLVDRRHDIGAPEHGDALGRQQALDAHRVERDIHVAADQG